MLQDPFLALYFFYCSYKKYDIIVGMYHDQVLTPIKTYLNLMQLI